MRSIAAALFLLALASPAQSADRCLQGASELGDRRALDALSAGIEAACPCDLATSRIAYRRCARPVRDAALRSGDLRQACRSAATRRYSEATCGTSLVTCGRYTPGSKSPIGCSVSSPLSCSDGRRFVETACPSDETHCSDVVDSTAGTCANTQKAGPFGAGARLVTYTKPSALNAAQTRTLDTVIWYPTAPGAGPVSPTYEAVFEAPLDASGGPYPVLLFSHGSCGYPLQSKFLLPLIASWGYVVVAPPHPGNTILQYPACGTPQAQAQSFVERPADMIFVLDQILAANQNPASPFFGAIEPEQIGMSGHSFGGLTTYLVQAREPRVKVAMPFAPAALFDPALTVPSLTMVGAIDSVVDNAATRAAFERSTGPRLWVEVAHSGHYTFSDGCFPTPDCDPPTTLTQDEAHELVKRFVLPFLRVHLEGDQSFAPFLDPRVVPAGVSFERED